MPPVTGEKWRAKTQKTCIGNSMHTVLGHQFIILHSRNNVSIRTDKTYDSEWFTRCFQTMASVSISKANTKT